MQGAAEEHQTASEISCAPHCLEANPHLLVSAVHLMRHGLTDMNVYLRKNIYGSPSFKDPMMWV